MTILNYNLSKKGILKNVCADQSAIHEKVFQKPAEVRQDLLCVPNQPSKFAIYEDDPAIHLEPASLISGVEKVAAGTAQQARLQSEIDKKESSVTYSGMPTLI